MKKIGLAKILSKIEKAKLLIEEASEELRGKVEQIDTFIDNRSEKWQESDKCDAFFQWGQDIDGMADELDTLAGEVEDFFESRLHEVEEPEL